MTKNGVVFSQPIILQRVILHRTLLVPVARRNVERKGKEKR